MNITDLELYLLSLMSARHLVAEVATRCRSSVQKFELLAQDLTLQNQLDKPVHSAAAYLKLAGSCPVVQESVQLEPGSPFAGSTRHRLQLATWSDVEFQVHEHPDGYAWGRGFTQATPRQVSSKRVVPWSWTASSLSALASSTEVVDEWSEYLVARFRFGSLVYVGTFDLDLLQSWEPTQ